MTICIQHDFYFFNDKIFDDKINLQLLIGGSTLLYNCNVTTFKPYFI